MTARRLPTLFAIGLVVAVGVAAVVDALRSVRPAPVSSTEPATTAAPGREAEALRAAGVVGVLVVARPNCRVDLLTLPDLTATTIEACARLEQSGSVVTLDGRLPSPADNISVASCTGEGVVLERADVTYPLAGCEPAWRPDGRLTVVHRGGLWEAEPPDARPRPFLSAAELRSLFDELLPPPDARSLEVTEAVWPSDTRLVAVLRKLEEPRYLLAAFQGKRLRLWRCCFEDLRTLRVSPAGGFVDVASEQGALVFDRGGGFFPVGIAAGRPADAVAWSPSDRFVAVARAGSVIVLDPGSEGLREIARLPIEAADLRWVASQRDVVLPEATN